MAKPERIAVIGCGVAGLTTAHLLQNRYEVTVFEKNDYLGGHTHTIVLPEGPDAGTPVDTGFIVCNDRTYPLFHKLLANLGVPVRDSIMSFSYHDEDSGFHYSGHNLNGLFAQRTNFFKPSFWRMLLDIKRFCKNGTLVLETDSLPNETIGDYLRRGGYGREFSEWYLFPMIAAIWSAPLSRTADFPAAALLRFFQNHGLLSLTNRPQWQTVEGGSHAYVQAFEKKFGGTIRLSCPISGVRRNNNGVAIVANGEEMFFEKVVIAAHADEALSLLLDASPKELRLLRPWSYQKNTVVLHTDTVVLPPTRRAWASWNYARERADTSDKPVSVSYYMNCLQGLQTSSDYSVSLNRCRSVSHDSVVCELDYMHPSYSFASMNTQAELASLNGVNNTYFCGSYFGYGFHEDAVRSSVDVCRSLGEDL